MKIETPNFIFTSVRAKFRSAFTLDLRFLAIFRILAGVVILVDTLQKAYWTRTFYTDWGFLPRTVALETFGAPGSLVIHFAMGNTAFQVALITLQVMAAVGVVVGWQTRLSSILLYVLMTSLQIRNTLILGASDDLLRLALFWSIFLPTGARFSLDAKRKGTPTSNAQYDIGSVAFVLQLFLVYSFSAMLKWHRAWNEDFTAVYYALSLGSFSTRLGLWLSHFHPLTKALTFATYTLEIFGPVLFFAGGWVRFIVIVSFLLMHAATVFTMSVGAFPFICIAYWSALLPSWLWGLPFLQRLETTRENQTAAKAETYEVKTANKVSFLIVTLSLILVVAINIRTLTKQFLLPYPARILSRTLSLYQIWDLFAPFPATEDGWYVIEGKFENGRALDLWTGKPVDWTQPSLISDLYPTTAWQKLSFRMRTEREALYLQMGRYYCRRFSKDEGEDSNLSQIDFQLMTLATPRMGERATPAIKRRVWAHDCFATAPPAPPMGHGQPRVP